MVLTINHLGTLYSFDSTQSLDISLAVRYDKLGVNCFYTNRPVFKPYQSGSFIGDVNKGGVCNVDTITFTPHGNGTHTECIGHITTERQIITDSLNQTLNMARLITVMPEIVNKDQIITLNILKNSFYETDVSALVIRTLPNDELKKQMDYSGTNPPYFSADALSFLNKSGIKHLLCDIPSVDREDDGGKLLAHKAFFGVPHSPKLDATITELIYVPSSIEDGLYLLDLQIAPFQSDASPSRPLLYALSSLMD